MKKEETWVKIYRKLLTSQVFVDGDGELLKVWIWCLLKATAQECDIPVGMQMVHLEPGQFVTGRKKAAEQLGISPQMYRNRMDLLEKMGMVTQKSTNKFTLVTVENWAVYQNDGEKTTNKKPAKNQQITSKKPTKNQQKTTKKNRQEQTRTDENRQDKGAERSPYDQALNDFVDMRKQIKKPMTDRAIVILENKLNTLASTEDEKIAILEQSIMNGWQSVYPLKNEKRQEEPKKQKTWMEIVAEIEEERENDVTGDGSDIANFNSGIS